MGARRLVRPSKRAGGGSGAGLLIAGVAAFAGVGLIAASSRKKASQEYERVGADELPQIGDFEGALEAAGRSHDVTQQGEAPRLDEGDDGLRMDVIDTAGEPARVDS